MYNNQIPESHVPIAAFENATSRFAVGTVWKLTLSEQDNDERQDSFRMTKSRPYLILAQTNNTVDIVPLSSTTSNMKNDEFTIEIPRVEGNEQAYSYVVLPKKERISYNEILDKYPRYLCSISRQLLLRILATNIVFETLSLSSEEVKIVASMSSTIRESINSVNYYNSPYMKYADSNSSASDIEATCTVDTIDASEDDDTSNNVAKSITYTINSKVKKLATELFVTPVSSKAAVIGTHKEVINDTICADDNSNISMKDFIIIYEHISGIKMIPKKLEKLLLDLGYSVTDDVITNANLRSLVDQDPDYKIAICKKYPRIIASIITGLSYGYVVKMAKTGVSGTAKKPDNTVDVDVSELYRPNYTINRSDTIFDAFKKILRKTDEPTTTTKEIFEKLNALGISKNQSDIEQSMRLSGFKFKVDGNIKKWHVTIIPEMGYSFDSIIKFTKIDLCKKMISIVNGGGKVNEDTLSDAEKKIVNAYVGWRSQNKISPPDDLTLIHTVNSHSMMYAALYYGINYQVVSARCQKYRSKKN